VPLWMLRLLITISGTCTVVNSFHTTCQGVFVTSREGTCFQFEVVELGNGKFRYWFYCDVPSDKHYPLEGAYVIEGSILHLQHPDLADKKFDFDLLGSTPVLVDRSSIFLDTKSMSINEMATKFMPWILIKMPFDKVDDLRTIIPRCVTEVDPAIVIQKPCRRCADRELSRGL
jgi:hypothetical protein